MQAQAQASVKTDGIAENKQGEGLARDDPSTPIPSGGADRFPQVVCFNYGESGHLCTRCTKPKVCFMCYRKDHIVDRCPEWKKPLTAAQYFGTANTGLGFYHIYVEQREGRF